jgi:hypothetical protein
MPAQEKKSASRRLQSDRIEASAPLIQQSFAIRDCASAAVSDDSPQRTHIQIRTGHCNSTD